jgi:hypothetical protein
MRRFSTTNPVCHGPQKRAIQVTPPNLLQM